MLWLGIESIKIKRWKKENERRIQKRVPKKEMEEQKSYGFTKILCCACGSKLKKRYLKSFDGSIIILLLRQLGVLSYFGWSNPSYGIIKS